MTEERPPGGGRWADATRIGGDPSWYRVETEARDILGGDRQADYGDARQNFERIAALWSALLGITVTPADVARCMIAMKLSRDVHAPKRDNVVDGIGYFILLDELR